MSNYTVHYNAKRACFIAKFRKPAGGWGTKFLPKGQFSPGQEAEATRWFLVYYGKLLAGELPDTPAPKVDAGCKTIAYYAPVWLKMLEAKRTISPAYLKRMRSTVNCWLLDNPKRPHVSIQGLDLERDFSAALVLRWLRSLESDGGLGVGAVRTVAECLRAFFHDLIAAEILSESAVNPMERPAVKDACQELRTLWRKRTEVVTVLSKEALTSLVTAPEDALPAWRRMRYTLALALMMRDAELQALTWSDCVLDATIPHVRVRAQLLKAGMLPPVRLEDERASKTIDQIMDTPHAVISDPKHGSSRTLPLHPFALEALRWWKRTGYKLCVGRPPTPVDPILPRTGRSAKAGEYSLPCTGAENLREDLLKLGHPDKCEGKTVVFHSLRHTGATLMEAAGVDEATIGQILGHGAGSVTREHYLAKQLPPFAAAIAKLPFPDPKAPRNVAKFTALVDVANKAANES